MNSVKKEMKKFICNYHKNGAVIKFNNKRVIVVELENNNIGLLFKNLCSEKEANTPSAAHNVYRNKLKTTGISLTEDAAIALYQALAYYLVKSDRLKIKTISAHE